MFNTETVQIRTDQLFFLRYVVKGNERFNMFLAVVELKVVITITIKWQN
jgi:hypothetical protein